MASVRECLVRRMYDLDYWELVESGNKYAMGNRSGLAISLYEAGFVAFDTYKTLLQDEEGNISGPRTVIAGFGAGITESLLAVTPFESIKTTLSVYPGELDENMRLVCLTSCQNR